MSTTFAIPRNNASTTVGGSGYTAGTYSLALATGGGALFPALTGSNYYRITVCQVAFAYSPTATAANYTIYKVTGVSGDTLTLSSTTLEGTSDRAYSVGDIVEVRVTAGTLGDIHTAVNNIENAGSNTQFHYNNSGSVAGSALLTQPNSNTVAIKGGTVGTVVATVSPATGSSIPAFTIYDILQFIRPSDSTVMGKISIGRGVSGTGDYDASYVYSTFFIGVPGPSPDNLGAGFQIYCDSTPAHAGNFGASVPGQASTNNMYFSSYSNTVGGWQEVFHCDVHDNTSGSHINIPIYSSGRHGIAIHGASGQTVDLQQWTDSTPTVLSGVGPAGHLRTVVQSSGGTPSGTPPTGSFVFDSSNNKLWTYNGSAWKSVTLA